MLPMLLLAVTQGPCHLLQSVKCDSAVVGIATGEGFAYEPVYVLIPHQTGYLLLLRIQGDQVSTVYPRYAARQNPVHVQDTLRVEDMRLKVTTTGGAWLLVLWSPQPIGVKTRLTSRWREVLKRTSDESPVERLSAFGQALTGPLETVAQLEVLDARVAIGRPRGGSGLDRSPDWVGPSGGGAERSMVGGAGFVGNQVLSPGLMITPCGLFSPTSGAGPTC